VTSTTEPVLAGLDRALAQFHAAFGPGSDAILADQCGRVLDVVGPLAGEIVARGRSMLDLQPGWRSDDLGECLEAVRQEHRHAGTAHAVAVDGASVHLRLFSVIGDDTVTRYLVATIFPDVDGLELRRLRHAEERSELIFERAPSGIALVDLDGRFIRANPAFCDIVGRSERELRTLTFQEITHPDDLAEDVDLVRDLVAGRIDRYSIEKRYLLPDGGEVWVQLTVAKFEVDGRIDHFVSMIEDVTQRRAAADDLQRALAVQEATFEHASVAMAEASLDGTIMRANAATGRLFGCDPADLVGTSTLDLLTSPEERADAQAQLRKLASCERRTMRRERFVVDRTGRERWLSVHTAAVVGPDGVPERLVMQAIDISVARRLQVQLEQSVDGLSTAFREKVGLMSALSHDLRAPLAAIRILAQLLAEQPDDDPHRRELVGRILAEAERTETVLGDLVAGDRAAAGLIVPRRVPVDVVAIAERAAGVHRAGGRHVVLEAPPTRPTVAGDPALLERLIDNLVSNAVRHTAGTAHVWVRVGTGPADAAGPRDVVVIEVDDDGDGVPDRLKEAVFEPYVRGHRDDRPGSGIGLFLVREFAEHHGGSAVCLDRPGGGARFRVVLPR
jgi:PAS domain S-box-containing protein